MFVTWFTELGLLGQIFFCIALPASIILIAQIVMSIVGFGSGGADGIDVGDNGIDGVFGADDPADATDIAGADLSDLQILSLRSIIAFLVTFGWMGLSLLSTSISDWLVILIAFVCGVVMMLIVAFLMRALYRLQSDGTADNRNAVGVAGTVYLKIPAKREGTGKVNVMLQGTLVEREAMTDSETPLPFGTEVTVLGVIGGSILLVAKK